jgi:hypothetical protein
MKYDRIITNVRVVRHDNPEPLDADIAISGGTIVEVSPGIDTSEATEVTDGKGRSRSPVWSTRTSTGASTTRSPKTQSPNPAPARKAESRLPSPTSALASTT